MFPLVRTYANQNWNFYLPLFLVSKNWLDNRFVWRVANKTTNQFSLHKLRMSHLRSRIVPQGNWHMLIGWDSFHCIVYNLVQKWSDRNNSEIDLLLSNFIHSWLYITLQSKRTAQGFFPLVFCSEQISNINNGKAECGLIFSPVDTFENSNLLQMVE